MTMPGCSVSLWEGIAIKRVERINKDRGKPKSNGAEAEEIFESKKQASLLYGHTMPVIWIASARVCVGQPYLFFEKFNLIIYRYKVFAKLSSSSAGLNLALFLTFLTHPPRVSTENQYFWKKSKLFQISWNGRKLVENDFWIFSQNRVCKTFFAKHEKIQSCSKLHWMARKLVEHDFLV